MDGIKRKRKKAIEKENEEGIFVIGIKVKGNGWEANQTFSDSHEVGRFIKKVVGEVKAVRISRGGIVIVECETTEQRDRALKIRSFGRADIACFSMRDKPSVKGVISGVPIDVMAESFLEVEGVCGARQLKSHREGKEQDSRSVFIEFAGEGVFRLCEL